MKTKANLARRAYRPRTRRTTGSERGGRDIDDSFREIITKKKNSDWECEDGMP